MTTNISTYVQYLFDLIDGEEQHRSSSDDLSTGSNKEIKSMKQREGISLLQISIALRAVPRNHLQNWDLMIIRYCVSSQCISTPVSFVPSRQNRAWISCIVFAQAAIISSNNWQVTPSILANFWSLSSGTNPQAVIGISDCTHIYKLFETSSSHGTIMSTFFLPSSLNQNRLPI